MSTGWNSHSMKDSSIDFSEVFADPTLNVIKLISLQNVVDECKNQQSVFTEKLIANEIILNDLLTICLRPARIHSLNLGEIARQHAFKALEIICSLQIQQFSDYMLGINKYSMLQEEAVVTEETMETNTVPEEIPLFAKVINSLKQQKPLQETAVSYICKIATNICSQKPKQVLRLFRQNKNGGLTTIFQHFYSNSILEFIIRILEIQDSTSFYEQQKLSIFQSLVHSLTLITTYQLSDRIDILENYAALLNFLYEKTDDRFDKSKFIILCKRIFPKKIPVDQLLTMARTLISKPFDSSTIQQIPYFLAIFERYLHFHHSYRPGLLTNINKSINNSSNNRSHGMGIGLIGQGNSGLDASVVLDVTLDAEIMAGLKEICVQISQKIAPERPSTLPLTFLLSFFKLVRSLFLILDQNEEDVVQAIISVELFSSFIQLLKKYKSSTILHNAFKDITIQCLIKNYEYTVSVLFEDNQEYFLNLANKINGASNSTELEFENQLYHIIQVSIKKGQDIANVVCWEDSKRKFMIIDQLISKTKDKEKLYTTLIGGDPRKESSCWGQDSQEDRIFTNEKAFTNSGNKMMEEVQSSANDVIQGKIQHWFDCGGLPLDSDDEKEEKDDSALEKRPQPLNSPICIELDSKQVPNFEPKQIQSDIAKRLKIIGVKQYEEKEIRISQHKGRYQNYQKNHQKDQMDDGAWEKPAQTKIQEEKNRRKSLDIVQKELQEQIRRLENKCNINQDEENQNQIGLNVMKVDVSEQEIIPDISARESNQPILISGLIDISSEDKSLSNKQVSENRSLSADKPTEKVCSEVLVASERDKSLKDETENKEYENDEKNAIAKQTDISKSKKSGDNNFFSTYLSYQIDQILAELD